MDISVLVATYERQDDLVETLQSLDRGFDTPEEVVVVDDGDVDRTRERLAAEDLEHVRLVEGDAEGLPAARNRCAEVATGDVYCFVDDDVVVPPNWLAEVRRTYEEHDLDGVCGYVLNYNPEGINKANVDTLGYRLLTSIRLLFFHDRVGDLSPVGICYAPHTMMTSDLRPTDTFQGCNMSFRAEVFEAEQFAEWYGSEGSTACEELEFSARVSAEGYDLWYNPRMVMLHKRTEEDESRFGEPNYDNITNLSYFVADHQRYGRANVALLGLAMVAYSVLSLDAGYFRGYLRGLRSARGERDDGRNPRETRRADDD